MTDQGSAPCLHNGDLAFLDQHVQQAAGDRQTFSGIINPIGQLGNGRHGYGGGWGLASHSLNTEAPERGVYFSSGPLHFYLDTFPQLLLRGVRLAPADVAGRKPGTVAKQ